MIYEVWSEGYAASGDSGGAFRLGIAEADTFAEACAKVAAEKPDAHLFDRERLTFWGCHLFDNRHDAQRSFG